MKPQIEIMADSCNGEELEFSIYCQTQGYQVKLRNESGCGSASQESLEEGNRLWEAYGKLSVASHRRFAKLADMQR